MLSNPTYRFLGTIVNVASFLRIFPWKWDMSKHQLLPVESIFSPFGLFKIKNFGFKLVSICYYCNFFFGIFRLFQSILFLGSDFQSIMFQIFIVTVSTTGTVLSVNSFLYGADFASLYTMYIENEKKLSQIYQTRKVFDRAIPFVMFFGGLGIAELPALVILYLANTAKPVYFGSLKFYIPREYRILRQSAEILFLFVEIQFSFLVVLYCIFYCICFITFLQSMAFWLDELRPFIPEEIQKKGGFRLKRPTKPEYRDFEVAKMQYRNFQLISKYIDGICKIALTGQHFCAAGLLVTCAFSTINFWGWHNFETIKTAIGYLIFPAAVLIFGVWIIIIQPQPAELKNRCPVFRKEWTHKVKLNFADNKTKQNECVKWINSRSDMTIEVGNFFVYQMSTMPAVMEVCLDNLVTLLLAAH